MLGLRTATDAIQQKLRRFLTKKDSRLIHAGQGVLRQGMVGSVVVANNGKVFRNAQPQITRHSDYLETNIVRPAEYCLCTTFTSQQSECRVTLPR